MKGQTIFKDKSTGNKLILKHKLMAVDSAGNQLDIDGIRELVRLGKEKGKIVECQFFEKDGKQMATIEWENGK